MIIKAITLRNIPEALARRIEERAGRSGASLNRTVIEMLTEKSSSESRRQDFERFSGRWSAEEADAFDAELAIMRTVESFSEE